MGLFNTLLSTGKNILQKINTPIPTEVSNPMKARADEKKKAMVFPVSEEGMKVVRKQVENEKKQPSKKVVSSDFMLRPAEEGSVLDSVKKGVNALFPAIPALQKSIETKSLAPLATLGSVIKKNITEGGKKIKEGLAEGATKEQRKLAIEQGLSMVDVGSTGEIRKRIGQEVSKEVLPKIQGFAKKLFRGSKGKVDEVDNTFQNVLEFPKDQRTVIRELAESGDEAAAKIIEEPKDFYQKADQLMREKYGKEYDAIKYKNEQMPAKGVEYQDLKDGRFYSEQKATAEAYSLQNRGGKYEPPKKVDGEMTVLSDFDAKKYVEENIAKRESARRAKDPTIIERTKDFYTNVKKKLIDSMSPIEDVLFAAQKKGKFQILPSKDISNQIDRVYRAPTLAGQFVKDNGLDTVIKNVDDLNNLDEYLVARHALNVESKGFKTGRDLNKDRALVETFKPQYEEVANQVTGYANKLLDYTTESGLISKETSLKLKELYPDYVPLNRIFNALELNVDDLVTKGRGVASISSQNVVQKLKGSEREIESPIASLLSKTNDAFSQGERNRAAQILASYEKLPENPFGLKELVGDEKASLEKAVIHFFDDGKLRKFEVNKDIAQAAKNLGIQQMNILGKILSVPVRIARAGITGFNLAFAGANVVADQVFSFITSKHALSTANPAVFVRALFETVNRGKLYDDFIRSAGGGTSFDLGREQVKPTLDRIRANKSLVSKIKYTVTHPSELLRTVENIIGRSEELTRIQQFKGTKDALLRQGRTEKDATILAAKAARENTANFYRKGEWGSVMNNAVLYLNAGIQGSRAFIRAMERNPIQTSAKIVAGLMIPVATITAWNLKDPKRKEAYEDIAEYEKEGNLVIIPQNPQKNEDGTWDVIKMKLPPGVSKLTIPVRRALEAANGMDELTFSEIANSLLTSILPFDITKVENGEVQADTGSILSTLTPQAVKPAIEGYVNKNLFTGQPIVSSKYEKLSPELQVKPTTSGSAELLGNALNFSPIKTEAFLKASGGGLASNILNAVDRVLAGFDIIPKDKIGGKSVIDSITARFTSARGGEDEQKLADEIKEILQKQTDTNFKLTQEAEVLYAELSGLPKEEANKKAKEIKKINEPLFNKLKSVAEDAKLNLTYDERLMKQLQVKNGERAKFIFGKLSQFETPAEKNAYMAELRQKKILSDEVRNQIKQLKELSEKVGS